jgi:hypothetical protein
MNAEMAVDQAIKALAEEESDERVNETAEEEEPPPLDFSQALTEDEAQLQAISDQHAGAGIGLETSLLLRILPILLQKQNEQQARYHQMTLHRMEALLAAQRSEMKRLQDRQRRQALALKHLSDALGNLTRVMSAQQQDIVLIRELFKDHRGYVLEHSKRTNDRFDMFIKHNSDMKQQMEMNMSLLREQLEAEKTSHLATKAAMSSFFTGSTLMIQKNGRHHKALKSTGASSTTTTSDRS